jgi:hypothetical protein
MSTREEIAAVAKEFLGLSPTEREVFIATLAEFGGTAEIIPIFEQFHQDLLENENE